MHYRRTILACLPLLITAAIASVFIVSWRQAIMGHSIGIVAGALIGHRGIRLMRAHICDDNRGGFGPMRRSMGILLFFILPAIAGVALAGLYQVQPGIVITVVVAASSCLATWWLLMAWWIWRIERRCGGEVVLLVDGFHLSNREMIR